MSVLDPRELEASPLADLHALASELGLEGFRRLRKQELIKQIVAAQGGELPPDEADADEPAPEIALYEDAAPEPEGTDGEAELPVAEAEEEAAEEEEAAADD